MKVVGLVSGGKDSIYSLMKCIEYGHQVVALANLRPADVQIQELDSFCFQTVGHNCVDAQAAAMRLPLFRSSLHGGSKNQDLQYTQTAEDEVEDLFTLLRAVQIAMPEVQAVSCGAILSTYQRTRVENVCRRLGLVALSFLWQRNQEELLHEMIGAGINAALIKVSSSGLLPRKHILRTLGDMESDFLKLAKTDGLNVCGEGGEYESLVLDCPLFFARIVIDEFSLVGELDNAFTPSGHALIQSFHLEPKSADFDSFPERTIQVQPESIVYQPTMHAVSSPLVDAKLSGSVCQSSHFTTVRVRAAPSGSVGDAMNQALQWAAAQLSERSLNFNDVFYSHMLLPSMSDYAVANSVYSTFFNLRPPSRCSVQLACSDEIVLELLATRSARDVLHVQSHSSWAPANIGPYAQASTLSGIVFLAGQIGLQPSRMQLPVPKSDAPLAQLRAESAQCLANCSAVLVGTGSNLGRLLSAVQYVAAESLDAASALTLAHSLLASTVSTAARKRFVECNFRNDFFDDEGVSQQGPIVRPKNTVPNVPILTVCVPALPRSAAVEIQLSSWQHRIDRALVVTEVDPQSHALDSGAGFVQHQALLSWQIACAAIVTLTLSDCAPSTAFAAALRSMQSHLDTADMSWSTIVHMRIFFQSSPTLTSQHVELHFAEAFGLLYPDLCAPAVTAIAVSAIHPSIGSAVSSAAADSEAPQIAMHGLWLDLERLASQSWFAGVRHAERLG